MEEIEARILTDVLIGRLSRAGFNFLISDYDNIVTQEHKQLGVVDNFEQLLSFLMNYFERNSMGVYSEAIRSINQSLTGDSLIKTFIIDDNGREYDIRSLAEYNKMTFDVLTEIHNSFFKQ